MPNTQFTKRLYEQVRTEALDYPIADVAKRHGISEFTVHSILKVYGAELDAQHHPAAPRILGIDEKHIAHKMRGVLVDIEHGKLLEMTKDNKRDDIISAIKSLNNYDKNIKYVTMDMSCGYASYVQELLPDALIVIDRFHVVQNIYKKTEKARKKIFVSLKERVAAMPEGEEKEQKTMLLKRLGKNSYLFKFGNGKLTEKESRISLMAELRETFPELDLLWRLRDAAENIYREADAECIDGYFADWEAMIPADPLFEDFWTLQRSMNRWKEQIFNYFYVRDELEECEEEDLRAPTNATTEGLNRLIDAINNSGFGYGFDILRIKCLYHTSAKDRPRKITKRVFSSRRSDFESFMSGGMTMNFVSTFSSLSMGRTEEVEEWVGGDGGSDIATLNELFEKGAI